MFRLCAQAWRPRPWPSLPGPHRAYTAPPTIFATLRQRRNEANAFLYAFDLLRREPIEVRKATLASILRKSRR